MATQMLLYIMWTLNVIRDGIVRFHWSPFNIDLFACAGSLVLHTQDNCFDQYVTSSEQKRKLFLYHKSTLSTPADILPCLIYDVRYRTLSVSMQRKLKTCSEMLISMGLKFDSKLLKCTAAPFQQNDIKYCWNLSNLLRKLCEIVCCFGV